MFNQLSNYIDDKTFKFTIYEDKIHIINFKRLITLEENYLSFSTNHKKINIIGEHFTLKKIVKNELLLTGIITKIEVIND